MYNPRRVSAENSTIFDRMGSLRPKLSSHNNQRMISYSLYNIITKVKQWFPTWLQDQHITTLTCNINFGLDWKQWYFTILLENTMHYTDPSGMISSPSFGGMYPSNANITYIITLPAFKQVFLKFSVFDLEPEVVQDALSMPGQNCADLLEVHS